MNISTESVIECLLDCLHQSVEPLRYAPGIQIALRADQEIDAVDAVAVAPFDTGVRTPHRIVVVGADTHSRVVADGQAARCERGKDAGDGKRGPDHHRPAPRSRME